MSKCSFHVAMLTVLMLAGCGQKRTVETESAPVPVRVMKAERTEGIVLRRYVGTAVPARSATVSNIYSGTLTSVGISRGDCVKKGDILAVVGSQSVLSMYETAEAALHQAEDGYERARKIYEKGGLADVKMVEIETRLAQARASAKAASKAVEDCTVRAPFDGTVSDVFVEEGTEISALAPVARIYDMSAMEIRFSVPENEIGNLKIGDAATVEVPALAADGVESANVFKAKVKDKGISGSALSHGYECTLSLLEECREFMPGMVCKIRIDNAGKGGFIVPSSLVRTDGSGKYVWGVTEDMSVRKIYVTTGGFVSRGVVITSGLEDGDTIITEGVQKVSTGMKVKFKFVE